MQNAKKTPKIRHLRTIRQLCRAISSQLRQVLTIGKKLVKQQYLLHILHNMVNFGSLKAEICWRVWGTPANFSWFRVLVALLHSTLVVGVSQTLQRWTEDATYIRQGGHYIGIGPHSSWRFIVSVIFKHLWIKASNWWYCNNVKEWVILIILGYVCNICTKHS